MKKLIAAFCLVAFVGVFANAQTTAADSKKATEGKVLKCTEAEKAECEAKAAKIGATCVTTDAKASAGTSSCSSTAKAGSCCKSGTASTGGSCCSKGKGEDKAEAAPADDNMKNTRSAKTAQVTTTDKK